MAMQELVDRLHGLGWGEDSISDVKQLVGRHAEPYKWLVLRPKYRDVGIFTSYRKPPLSIKARVRREPGYRRARIEIFDVSDYRANGRDE